MYMYNSKEKDFWAAQPSQKSVISVEGNAHALNTCAIIVDYKHKLVITMVMTTINSTQMHLLLNFYY